MQCSDLERYLEAYLDLKLGRSRGAILRRHLSGCVACRLKVDRLRQFERELQRYFRAMERVGSVWSGLEPDLVRSGGQASLPALPLFLSSDMVRGASASAAAVGPRQASHGTVRTLRPASAQRGHSTLRRWGRRLVGAVLISAAVGAAASLGRYWLTESWVASTVRAYLWFRNGHDRLELKTNQAAQLADWVAARVGFVLPLPQTPPGFTLQGGRFEQIGEVATATVVYTRGDQATLLYITPRVAGQTTDVTSPDAGTTDGISHVLWAMQDAAYSVVSTLPPSDLMAFAEPQRPG
jgi:anti-sigma factor RsiW